jgi:hypothetical protein
MLKAEQARMEESIFSSILLWSNPGRGPSFAFVAAQAAYFQL